MVPNHGTRSTKTRASKTNQVDLNRPQHIERRDPVRFGIGTIDRMFSSQPRQDYFFEDTLVSFGASEMTAEVTIKLMEPKRYKTTQHLEQQQGVGRIVCRSLKRPHQK